MGDGTQEKDPQHRGALTYFNVGTARGAAIIALISTAALVVKEYGDVPVVGIFALPGIVGFVIGMYASIILSGSFHGGEFWPVWVFGTPVNFGIFWFLAAAIQQFRDKHNRSESQS